MLSTFLVPLPLCLGEPVSHRFENRCPREETEHVALWNCRTKNQGSFKTTKSADISDHIPY